MSDVAPETQLCLPLGAELRPVAGIKGYLERRQQWDGLVLAFDEGRLVHADRRLVASVLEAKLASRSRATSPWCSVL